jgi:hypothetical protein
MRPPTLPAAGSSRDAVFTAQAAIIQPLSRNMASGVKNLWPFGAESAARGTPYDFKKPKTVTIEARTTSGGDLESKLKVE